MVIKESTVPFSLIFFFGLSGSAILARLFFSELHLLQRPDTTPSDRIKIQPFGERTVCIYCKAGMTKRLPKLYKELLQSRILMAKEVFFGRS